jgi:FdhD protein
MTSRYIQEPSRQVPIRRIGAGGLHAGEDNVAVEEPLEICLAWPEPDLPERGDTRQGGRNIAVTMRTPGNDAELAVGFLFTEGILQSFSQVAGIVAAADSANRVTVALHARPHLDAMQLARNFYITSSCGVCGKASIEAIRTHAQFPPGGETFAIRADCLLQLPAELEAQQAVFKGTGSIHAAALFDKNGLESSVYEDVGRHNAVDKLIGAALMSGRIPLADHGLLVSGRASFELVQKARMAGCAMLAAVGAPSSLAIDLAWDAGMTLIGFLRDGRFNVYAGPARIRV